MKKATILCLSAVILIVLCGIITGCKKESSPEPAPAPAEETPPAPITTPAPEPAPAEEPVIEYTLHTSVSPDGSGTVEPDSATHDAGTELKLTATPASGYTFDHWSGDVTGNSKTVTVTMNSDITATAHFKRQYTLSTSVTPQGSGKVSPDSGLCDAGSKLKLTATPLFGHTFDHWSGDATGTTNPVTITMDSDKSVTASFTTVFKLGTSISPADGGSIELNPERSVYKAGTEVTLTATAADGYAFDSWGGDATGRVITTTIVMDADKSVTASFRNLLAEGILFEDNFDDDRNKWYGKVRDGALHITDRAPEGQTYASFMFKWPFESPNYPNFGYEVEMTPIEADETWGRGIIFLRDPAKSTSGRQEHYFLFIISGKGSYKLIRNEGENSRDIIGWTASSFINRGKNVNKLKVLCRDSVIELYVNGHLLKRVQGEFPDNIYDNGIGFYIVTAGGYADIAFDNMKMWVLD